MSNHAGTSAPPDRRYYIGSEINEVRKLHQDVLSQPHGTMPIDACLSAQAENLLHGHAVKNPAVVFQLRCWCPGLISRPAVEIFRHPLTKQECLEAVALEHGFASWAQVQGSVDVEFEAAVDALLHGEIEVFTQIINHNPRLVQHRSAYGHGAMLLHYLGANGVETHRQVTPYNARQFCELLISTGADISASAGMYGGSTVLGLLETSIHPHKAGVTESVAALLRSHGAG